MLPPLLGGQEKIHGKKTPTSCPANAHPPRARALLSPQPDANHPARWTLLSSPALDVRLMTALQVLQDSKGGMGGRHAATTQGPPERCRARAAACGVFLSWGRAAVLHAAAAAAPPGVWRCCCCCFFNTRGQAQRFAPPGLPLPSPSSSQPARGMTSTSSAARSCVAAQTKYGSCGRPIRTPTAKSLPVSKPWS